MTDTYTETATDSDSDNVERWEDIDDTQTETAGPDNGHADQAYDETAVRDNGKRR